MSDDDQEGSMAELIPMDSEARHSMRPDEEAHLERVSVDALSMIRQKYRRGQVEHDGQLWIKPGMLAHALEESTDLVIYLLTMREQIGELVTELREEGLTAAAERIERLLRT